MTKQQDNAKYYATHREDIAKQKAEYYAVRRVELRHQNAEYKPSNCSWHTPKQQREEARKKRMKQSNA
jgi:hypothetical protein